MGPCALPVAAGLARGRSVVAAPIEGVQTGRGRGGGGEERDEGSLRGGGALPLL